MPHIILRKESRDLILFLWINFRSEDQSPWYRGAGYLDEGLPAGAEHPDGKRARIIPWIHNPDANSRHAYLDLNGRDISRIIPRIFALFFTVSPRDPECRSSNGVLVLRFQSFRTLFLNVKNDAPMLSQRCIYLMSHQFYFLFFKTIELFNLLYIQIVR